MTAQAAAIRRVVLYTTGDLDDQAAALKEHALYAETQGWQVTKERTDIDVSESAWLRKGILSCITIVCHGNADGVLMPHAAFMTFSGSDQEWIRQRLRRFGGFLHVIQQPTEATLCATATTQHPHTP
jgi:hypothetical protein